MEKHTRKPELETELLHLMERTNIKNDRYYRESSKFIHEIATRNPDPKQAYAFVAGTSQLLNAIPTGETDEFIEIPTLHLLIYKIIVPLALEAMQTLSSSELAEILEKPLASKMKKALIERLLTVAERDRDQEALDALESTSSYYVDPMYEGQFRDLIDQLEKEGCTRTYVHDDVWRFDF